MNECQYCGKPLHRIYPDAEFDLGWAHTTRAAALSCVRPSSSWPTPVAAAVQVKVEPQ